MKMRSTLGLVLLFVGCQTPAANDVPIDALVASQAQTYVVPAGVGDTGFVTAASMAAIVWSGLTEDQLVDWFAVWESIQEAPDRPLAPYLDSSGASQDLFLASARDGFCVSFAHMQMGTLDQPRASDFMAELRRPGH